MPRKITVTFHCEHGQDTCPKPPGEPTWKVEAFRYAQKEYDGTKSPDVAAIGIKEDRIMVLRTEALCPMCGFSGTAEADETVYLLTPRDLGLES